MQLFEKKEWSFFERKKKTITKINEFDAFIGSSFGPCSSKPQHSRVREEKHRELRTARGKKTNPGEHTALGRRWGLGLWNRGDGLKRKP